VALQRDFAVDEERRAKPLDGDPRAIAQDDAGLLQRPDAREAGTGAEPDALSERGIGDAALPLQKGEDALVQPVEALDGVSSPTP
jgi:hypothetical protein